MNSGIAPSVRRSGAPTVSRTSSAGRRAEQGLVLASHALWWVGAVACALSFTDGPAWLLALGSAFLMLGFVCRDASRARNGGLTPITVVAFSSGLTALANATGLLAAYTPLRSRYFLYADDSHLLVATQIFLIGTLLTIIGFRIATSRPETRTLFAAMPRVQGNLNDRSLLWGGSFLAVGCIVGHVLLKTSSPGSVLGTFFLVPHIVAFLLARAATQRRVRGALAAALIIATLEGVRALFFAYLRTDIAAPFLAVILGALLGARSLAPLRNRLFIPLYAFALIFIVYFNAFANARTTSGGLERLEAVSGAGAGEEVAQQKQGVWGRLSNFNQLSQVGLIASEDGFLHGQTLEYLGFVFVPRFLWPDKPIIQKGGWFAWRIGQARILPDGRYSNAVNMTIPGELYLNFAWTGVAIGCFLFGTILASLWSRTSFWSRRRNLTGAAFGYYLYWTSLTLGADLQIIVTLISTYLIFVALGVGLRVVVRRRMGGPGIQTDGRTRQTSRTVNVAAGVGA